MKRKRRRPAEAIEHLQITALADILMVVLLFLLKSFASGMDAVENVSVRDGIVLPVVEAAEGAKTGIHVEISEGGIKLGGKAVARLNRYQFPRRDLNRDLTNNGTSRTLMRAFATFTTDRKPAEKSEEPEVWIVADHRAPYATIQTVMASAAFQGYSNFKLVVMKED